MALHSKKPLTSCSLLLEPRIHIVIMITSQMKFITGKQVLSSHIAFDLKDKILYVLKENDKVFQCSDYFVIILWYWHCDCVFTVVKLGCTEREFALIIFLWQRESVITQLISVVFFSFQCPTFYSYNWISDISRQDYSCFYVSVLYTFTLPSYV